jgi:predicted dehydrogenase
MEGDLKISNERSFQNAEDIKLKVRKETAKPSVFSRYPSQYQGLPASKLDASVLDLAYLYAAYANDRVQGTHDAPTFADAVRMHRLIDLIEEASSTGVRQPVKFW